MRRILVTGASGFVGGHLLPRLRAAFPDAEISGPGVAFDLRDAGTVAAEIAGRPPDACVHLAAVSAIPAARTNPGLAWQINLHGTLALAEALMRSAPECLLLYPSSADGYGASFRAGRPLDENAPLAPMNTYGATKAAADLALGAMAAEGLRVVRLRPFNHTGAGQLPDFVVPAFARQIARIAAGMQEPVMRVGALDPQRDFLDVRDVCDAYVACLRHRDGLAPGTIFNIASGTPRRIGDVLEAMLHLAGIAPAIETGAALLRRADIPTAAGDAGAIRAALGWRPRIAWEQTLEDVLADWRLRAAAAA